MGKSLAVDFLHGNPMFTFVIRKFQMKNTRQFFMVNPTATPYTFKWCCEDEDDPKKVESSVFTCVTHQGQVASGKKTQVRYTQLISD